MYMKDRQIIQLWDDIEEELHRRTVDYITDPMSKWIDPFRIFGKLYYIGDQVVCSHLLDTGDGLILFDSGFPHTADLLRKRIAMLGFECKDIRYILHTHEHYDHFGASYKLQTDYGCRTYIHSAGAHTFRIFPHHTEVQSAHCPDASLFIPDVEFNDGDIVSLGNISVRCIYTPGHSAGTTTFVFELQEGDLRKKAAICGINGTLPLHKGRLLKYGIPLSTREQYLLSIEKIRKEEIDITLDTHPRPRGILDTRSLQLEKPELNPFIDPSAWERNLNDYRARFNDFIEAESEKLSHE